MEPLTTPGTKITVGYRMARKDSTQPWLETTRYGIVLAPNDPRAWANTGAFYDRTPSQEEVNAHLAKPTVAQAMSRCQDVPVLWDFGRIYWEPADALLSAEVAQ